jgi:EAL domain-containing protein (putative c-di-GMP-specific phosphodiesterase class I)
MHFQPDVVPREVASSTMPLGWIPSPPAVPGADAAPQPRILLLDDDPFQLVMQSFRLKGAGFDRVGTLERACAALEVLQRDPDAYDVIICDLNMPGMDGIEFLQRLGAGPCTAQVILLSGEGSRIMQSVQSVQALLSRARLFILGVVEKPGLGDELPALLRRWKPSLAGVNSRVEPCFEAAEVERAARERQWVLHYQPKIDLRTAELAGMEALVRWQHPEHGLVYPDRFVGIAEDCGAIDMLTDWVLGEAIGQLAAWQGEGLQMRMAVNVSMENLRSAEFTGRLTRIVQNAGVFTGDVTLEITESRLMAPTPIPLENLVRLRLRRYGLSIDDFGTGHSSLAQLRDAPFAELKVDRSFVSGARFDPIIRPILEGSINLARGLGMKSVAEGVETEDDWQLLRAIGCDLAQGYFIGRPMPCEAVEGWITAWQARRATLVAT